METEQQSATSTPAATQPASVTPTPAPAPDAQTPATPAAVTPAPPIPDTGSTIADTMAKVDPKVQEQQAHYKAASDLAKAPVIPPDAPHAKLLQMISSLATGLSAFGTAMGTYGKEGGAKEVAEIQGEQQRQKLEAQQSAMNQRNQQIQQQITLGDTAGKMAQTIFLMAQGPLEWQAKDLAVKQGQQSLSTGAQSAQIQLADFMKQNWGFSPAEITGANSGQTSATADPAHIQTAQTMLTRTVGDPSDPNTTGAVAILGKDNPAVQNALTAAKDPKATVQSILAAGQGLDVALQQNAQVQEARTKKEAAEAGSPVAKLGTPEALAAPGSQAAIQAKIDDPATDPKDIPRLQALLPQAYAAQKNAETIKKREAAADQAIKMGDPNEAGKLLASHQTTISELKSRGMTPEYITKSINAATKLDPQYNAVADDNYAKIAGSEANNQFFGNAGSLISSGGTLDQLAEVSKQLSQSDIQALNKLTNWADVQVGKGGVSATAAKAVGVADDYAKVMGGSVGSDATSAMVMHIIDPALSPDQRAQSIQAMKDSVVSQTSSRIGNNPWLKLQYGSLITPAAPEGHQVNLAGGGTATKKGGKWINDQTGQEVK